MLELSVQEAIERIRSDEIRLEALQNQLISLTAALQEIQVTKNTLDNLPKTEKASLVPLGSGIYTTTKLLPSDKVSMNIGAGIVVEKTIEEAKDLLENRENQLKEAIQQVQKTIQQVSKQSIEIRRKLEEYMKRQKSQQPVIG